MGQWGNVGRYLTVLGCWVRNPPPHFNEIPPVKKKTTQNKICVRGICCGCVSKRRRLTARRLTDAISGAIDERIKIPHVEILFKALRFKFGGFWPELWVGMNRLARERREGSSRCSSVSQKEKPCVHSDNSIQGKGTENRKRPQMCTRTPTPSLSIFGGGVLVVVFWWWWCEM